MRSLPRWTGYWISRDDRKDAKSLIESYVDDVARRLPRKIRNEVGPELRALLAEHVAARYGGQHGFNLIEPEHAPAFVKIAVLGVAAQGEFTLPRALDASRTFGGSSRGRVGRRQPVRVNPRDQKLSRRRTYALRPGSGYPWAS